MLTLLDHRAKSNRPKRNLRLLRSALIATLPGLLAGMALCAQADEVELNISAAAPDFALASSAGKNLRLSEHRGAVVILNFWTSGCGPCREQLDWMSAVAQSSRFTGVDILSVNIESDRHRAMHTLQSQQLSFPVLFDTGKSVTRIYDPSKLPMIVMIDPHGSVRFIHEGHRAGDAAKLEQELTSLLAE